MSRRKKIPDIPIIDPNDPRYWKDRLIRYINKYGFQPEPNVNFYESGMSLDLIQLESTPLVSPVISPIITPSHSPRYGRIA